MGKQKSLKQIEGIAKNVRWDRIPQGKDILSFRIEKTDNEGNSVDYVPVYLTAPEIAGVLVDGDQVKVTGFIDKNGTLKPKKVSVTKGDTETHLGFSTGELSCVFVIFGLFSLSIFIIYILFVLPENQRTERFNQLYRERRLCEQNASSDDARSECWDDYLKKLDVLYPK